jgi:hypothetical protein
MPVASGYQQQVNHIIPECSERIVGMLPKNVCSHDIELQCSKATRVLRKHMTLTEQFSTQARRHR